MTWKKFQIEKMKQLYTYIKRFKSIKKMESI